MIRFSTRRDLCLGGDKDCLDIQDRAFYDFYSKNPSNNQNCRAGSSYRSLLECGWKGHIINRKKILFFLMFSVVMLMTSFPVQSASGGDRILGTWITPEKDRIQIYKAGERYYGKPSVQPGMAKRLDLEDGNL